MVRCKIIRGSTERIQLIEVFRRGSYGLEPNNKIIFHADFRKCFEKDFSVHFFKLLIVRSNVFFLFIVHRQIKLSWNEKHFYFRRYRWFPANQFSHINYLWLKPNGITPACSMAWTWEFGIHVQVAGISSMGRQRRGRLLMLIP